MGACGHGGTQVAREPTAVPEIRYIGPPGAPPNTKTMSASAYGAYTFSSTDNYCHMARWLIGGTVLPEYSDEQKPLLIRRNTKATVMGSEFATCYLRGQHVDMEDTTLTKVEIASGPHKGAIRFLRPSDLYTQEKYREYAHYQRALEQDAKKRPQIAGNRDSHYMKTYKAELAMLIDPDVWGPSLSQSLQSFCSGMAYQNAHKTGRDPSFSEMRQIEPGYDEIRQGQYVQVIGGPAKDACLGLTWYRVRVVGPPARGGHTTGWMMNTALDD